MTSGGMFLQGAQHLRQLGGAEFAGSTRSVTVLSETNRIHIATVTVSVR
jgi:hypothetical protein